MEKIISMKKKDNFSKELQEKITALTDFIEGHIEEKKWCKTFMDNGKLFVVLQNYLQRVQILGSVDENIKMYEESFIQKKKDLQKEIKSIDDNKGSIMVNHKIMIADHEATEVVTKNAFLRFLRTGKQSHFEKADKIIMDENKAHIARMEYAQQNQMQHPQARPPLTVPSEKDNKIKH